MGNSETQPATSAARGRPAEDLAASDGPNTVGESSESIREVELREHVEAINSVVEAERDADGRHVVEVTLIRSGTSKNGNHYPPDVLARAVPLFEGSPAFADHQKQPHLPEGSVKDIIGYYGDVRAIAEPSGQTGLRAKLHLLPTAEWLFHLLRAAESNPRLCGISIDAWANVDESKSSRGRRHIADIHRVQSADIVTRPSAGGQVQRVIQSDYSSSPLHPQESPTMEAEAHSPEDTAASPPDLTRVIEQLQQEREAAQRELARVQQVLDPAGSTAATDSGADIARLVEEIRRERDLARAEQLLAATLAEAALPAPVAAKLRKQFAGRAVDLAVLEAPINDEREVLAQLSSSGEIRGMGYERPVSVGLSDYEQVQCAFDKMFDVCESEAARAVPAFSGIREAFAVATGVDISSIGGADRALKESVAQGLRNYVAHSRLSEAETLLREADVTTASFSALLGTSMNKRLLKDYQAWPSEWQKITTITAIRDFKAQTRVRLGAFGSLSTVAEDAQYTTLTLSDISATYSPAKRGNLVQVTRETIINDDLYAIKQIPQKLAVAAAFTLAEFVYNLLAPGGAAIYDTHPLFDSINHKNTGIAAANVGTANSGTVLSSAALQAAVIAMRKQTNLAGKPIGLKPRYLLVPPDLEFSAMTILRSAGLPGGNNNDINPMMGYAEPIIAPQLNSLAAGPTTTTSWIAVADPRVIDTLEVGFVGGQANPVLLIQDMPLYGLNFTQDTISYKVRHEYGGAVVDYRGFYLGNN